MDWQGRMNQSIAWIEEHLTDEVTWEDAAREANCSLFHFLRMFEVITGMTAEEYVRQRRLSLAAMELASTDAIHVPAATWGIFESRGPIPEAFQAVMQRIYGEWFPSSSREHADGPELEMSAPGDVRAPDYYSETWIPLQKPPG